MLNRDVFKVPPEAYRIPNDGVAKIVFLPRPAPPPRHSEDELRTFVTDGEFGRGLLRVLESFRSGLSHGAQKAVWISGFYGSGKSHLAKMLCALWTDQAFPDGSRPGTLIPEPAAELAAELRALRPQLNALAACTGGGTLGGGADDPKLATLGIVLQSVGLPLDLRAARVAFWLADEGILDAVRTRLGGGFDSATPQFRALNRFPSGGDGGEALSLAASARDLSDRLKDTFRQPPEITVNELSSTVRRALLLGRKELPLTLVVS